jgi:hypothetical protein
MQISFTHWLLIIKKICPLKQMIVLTWKRHTAIEKPQKYLILSALSEKGIVSIHNFYRKVFH